MIEPYRDIVIIILVYCSIFLLISIRVIWSTITREDPATIRQLLNKSRHVFALFITIVFFGWFHFQGLTASSIKSPVVSLPSPMVSSANSDSPTDQHYFNIFSIFLLVVTGLIFYAVKEGHDNIKYVVKEGHNNIKNEHANTKKYVENAMEKIQDNVQVNLSIIKNVLDENKIYAEDLKSLKKEANIMYNRNNILVGRYNQETERVFNLLEQFAVSGSIDEAESAELRNRFVVYKEVFLLEHSEERARLLALIQISAFLDQNEYKDIVNTDQILERLEWIAENDTSKDIKTKAKEVIKKMWRVRGTV